MRQGPAKLPVAPLAEGRVVEAGHTVSGNGGIALEWQSMSGQLRSFGRRSTRAVGPGLARAGGVAMRLGVAAVAFAVLSLLVHFLVMYDAKGPGSAVAAGGPTTRPLVEVADIVVEPDVAPALTISSHNGVVAPASQAPGARESKAAAIHADTLERSAASDHAGLDQTRALQPPRKARHRSRVVERVVDPRPPAGNRRWTATFFSNVQ